jgi:hypothetical protein
LITYVSEVLAVLEQKVDLTAASCEDIPMPIIKLNRWILAVGGLLGLLFQQPLVTTALFLLLLPSVVWGQRASLIFHLGSRIFAARVPFAEREDRRLQRFNNLIAFSMLGVAQVSFVVGLPIVGWVFVMAVVLAASIALAGFCVGCFLYYQFKLNRYRLFNF